MLLLIDNYDSFTWNLVHYFGELGAEVVVRRNDALDVQQAMGMRPDGIVLSPGPCDPRQAGICLPLIGAIDTQRATAIMETLLEGVAERNARVVLLDITGVPVVDTSVAHHLIQAARAVRLLGAEIVLVGIRPEIAQTIVQLGVDRSGIATMADLQGGVAYALQRLDLAIVTRSRAALATPAGQP